jgi:uncharacterized protein (DUF58 family)
VLVLALYFLGQYTGSYVYYYAIWMLGFALLISLLSLPFLRRGVIVTVVTQRSFCSRGKATPVAIKAVNRTIFPFVRVELCGKIPHREDFAKRLILTVPSLGSVEESYELEHPHCGHYNLGVESVRISDPFGLFVIKSKALNNLGGIYVLPLLFDVKSKTSGELESNNTRQLMQRTTEHEELFEIHPFTNSDYIRNIHWKQTAKQRELMAAVYEKPKDDGLLLLIDCNYNGSLDSEEALSVGDAAGDAALSYAKAAIKENKTVKAVIFRGSKSFQSDPVSGEAGVHSLAISFAELQPIELDTSGESLLAPFLSEAIQYGEVVLISHQKTKEQVDALLGFEGKGIRIKLHETV